jgi:hypothetical protein
MRDIARVGEQELRHIDYSKIHATRPAPGVVESRHSVG